MAEKNNPVLPIVETIGNHGLSNVKGTVESGYNGETAEVRDVNKTKKINAPANPPSTWSADSPY